MIVVLKRGAEQDKREQLNNWLKNQGLGVHISEGEYQTQPLTEAMSGAA